MSYDVCVYCNPRNGPFVKEDLVDPNSVSMSASAQLLL